jgi:hypothetical protein
MPPPEPRSSTTSPGCSAARAVGLPQPRLASTASSGRAAASAAEYRSAVMTSPPVASVLSSGPQHDARPARSVTRRAAAP